MYIQNSAIQTSNIKASPSNADKDIWLRLSDLTLVSLSPHEAQQVITELTREVQARIAAAQVQS